jgi:hypothetical protein
MRRARRSAKRGGTKSLTWDRIRAMGLALPGVEEGTTYGTPALKVRGQMFTCIPSHRSAEPDSLAVRIPFEQRDELLEAATYYIKAHYENYAVVLVRLGKIHPDALRDLLTASHQFVASRARIRRPRTRTSRTPSADR